jgi:hypothetical protein
MFGWLPHWKAIKDLVEVIFVYSKRFAICREKVFIQVRPNYVVDFKRVFGIEQIDVKEVSVSPASFTSTEAVGEQWRLRRHQPASIWRWRSSWRLKASRILQIRFRALSRSWMQKMSGLVHTPSL